MAFLANIAKKSQKVIQHGRNEIIGILNPNRTATTLMNALGVANKISSGRHDSPEDIAQDEVRAAICASHRFGSFADERLNNDVKWHIDGHDYMWALSEMLDNAKEAIFILDWWLTPELYLRRPAAHFPEWRLDRILKRKAEQGVKVYAIVYKEVTQTMNMCSKHTKHTLDDLHPNVRCMRHPDHIGTKDSVQFWSHHEKVHMTLVGSAVLDITQHFVERWNEIKKRKYRFDTRYDWLDLPHDPDAAEEAVARHPHREKWPEIGRKYKQRWHGTTLGDDRDEGYYQPRRRNCRVQVVRSVADWSHGVLPEHSIQNAYIQMIQEAKHHIYIENQFFISATKPGQQIKNLIAQALVERILRAAREGKKFKVVVCLPELPGFAGDIKSETSLKIIMAAQYLTINRGGASICEMIKHAGYDPSDYISFYHLRAYDRINAPMGSFISQMEQNSGITFHEAQVALARQWIGEDPTSTQREVTLIIPSATTEGIVVSDKTPPKTATVHIPESAEAARAIVERFENGARGLRGDEGVSDTVSQHMLSDRTSLLAEKWPGTPEEELNAYVSELLYVHSKLMIVDDERVIMGSANINDRSQKGDGDSEICLVVEDDNRIDSIMDGQPYKASRFAATLRRKLYREHLGLIPPQMPVDGNPPVTSFMRPAPHPNEDETYLEHDKLVVDPLGASTVSLLTGTARKNREIFTEIFRPVPTNLVRDWGAYDRYVPKVKTGHVSPDIPLNRVKDRLSQVRGSLVECPLDFLIDDRDFVTGPEWKGLNPTLPIYI
ncbi:hypothetical protein DXG03_005423 [Asterophora parasitica]|uniref:phospholipase D n=1 Tax=Asterophora parasitica TaxID=117018 RepID=A0A9P7GEI6_9AGAR|nr:hypothetical protein DXG03_005423 [Asterophora parasitica]